MKAIAKTLDVARSNLMERLGKKGPERVTYRKTDDSDLLPHIKELVDARPTYGYRRITALLNRRFKAADQPRVNHKRIYRIMQLHGLLLQRHTGRCIERARDGVGRTLRSNMRWCSDGFEIACWNEEIVRVAFTLDTCDREAITWTGTTAGISGEMVRDVMLMRSNADSALTWHHIGLSFWPTMAAAIPPTRRSTSRSPSGSCRALGRSAPPNRTAWQSHS